MTGQYKGNDLQWRPIATVTGGGPAEKIEFDASLGSSSAPAVAAVGDEIWGHFEPVAGGVNLSYAFQGMSGITTVPAFDTSSATGMSYMFQGCSSLATVPLFDTGSVTTMASMFNGCSSLTEVPAFDTSSVTSMNSTFNGCSSLVEVPAISMAAATTSTPFTNAFGQAGTATTNKATQLQSCTRFRAYGATRRFVISGTQMDAAALDELMANLGTSGGAQTIDIRFNPGSATCDPSIATAKGWTVLT